MQVMASRMLQSVPKADVVVTNPTHLAVALRYNAKGSPAPIVIAKGADPSGRENQGNRPSKQCSRARKRAFGTGFV